MQMDIIKTTYNKLRVTSDCQRDEKQKQGRERISRYGFQDVGLHLEKTYISQENRKIQRGKMEKNTITQTLSFIFTYFLMK